MALRKSLFWRLHFWAALIASPFALLAALTGLLYVFTPQIESALYAQLDHVAPAGKRLPLDRLVASAQQAAGPDKLIRAVQTPQQPGDSVRVYVQANHDHAAMHGNHDGHAAAPRTIVYVNPYTAAVLGSQPEDQRFVAWAQQLHSSLLQGEGWRWMIELAASWLMVMLLTGIYLWWPRHHQSGLPQRGASGRRAWQQWHSFIGIALSLISLVILTTGLTWSKFGGEQVRALRDAVGQTPPRAPKGLHSTPPLPDATPLSWQAAWDKALNHAPGGAMLLTPPADAQGVWRVTSAKVGEPDQRFELLLDAYTGAKRYYAGWDRQTAFSKATAIGIPFHRGEFGWWNQALLLLFGLGVLFSIVSGWVMYFKRLQPGAPRLPKLLPGAWRAVPPAIGLLALALLILLPLLAASASLLLLLELYLGRRAST